MEKKSESSSDKNSHDNSTSFLPKFSDLKSELTRVTWSSKEELKKQTLTVILTSLLFGVIIVSMDFVFNLGFQFFVQFLN